jgi:hypothetical protein
LNPKGPPAPPLADTVNEKVVLVSPLVGDTPAVTAMSEIVTETDEDAVPPLPSVAMTFAWYGPACVYA